MVDNAGSAAPAHASCLDRRDRYVRLQSRVKGSELGRMLIGKVDATASVMQDKIALRHAAWDSDPHSQKYDESDRAARDAEREWNTATRMLLEFTELVASAIEVNRG